MMAVLRQRKKIEDLENRQGIAEVHNEKFNPKHQPACHGRLSWLYVFLLSSLFFNLVLVHVVNKKSMEKLFQREDVLNFENSSYDEKNNNVNKSRKEIHEKATIYLSKPVCMFQIRNACAKDPDLPYFGWFSDNEKGGPVASSAEACNNRKRDWENTCPDGDVDLFYDPSWAEKETSSIPESKCRFKVVGNCKEFPSLSNTEWFLDEDKGGPKSSTLMHCQLRKKEWETSCVSNVEMDFSGPGQILPGGNDSEWSFHDIDGAVITLMPNLDKSTTYKSCFNMSREPSLPSISSIYFCYPTFNIYGHPKAGTSALYYILAQHTNIRHAHSKKEYCRVRPGDKPYSFFRYLYGFATATKDIKVESDVLVNGCIMGPKSYLELDYLLKGPKTLPMYLIRDAADRSWATYNYWCDWNSEPDCKFGGLVKPGIHNRSPENFHDLIMNNEPKKLLIPNEGELSNLYTAPIKLMESMGILKFVHVIANEKMKEDLFSVWDDLSKSLNSVMSYNIPMHDKLENLSGVIVNANDKANILPKTAKLLTLWWEECEELSSRSSWSYNCIMKNTGYKTMKEFKDVDLQEPLKDSYITLWLHQVHTWFAADANQTSSSRLKTFIADAKSSGFKQLMFDVPWAWTERDAKGDLQIDSFYKEDVMSTACELGLSLNIVITMRELPLWMNDKTFFEKGSVGKRCPRKAQTTTSPSVANPEVWKNAKEYVAAVTKLLLQKYGDCIVSMSPSFNNEFETRYSQEWSAMRDYSNFSIASYKEWRIEKELSPSNIMSDSPPHFQCSGFCDPIIDMDVHNWLGFREEFLSNKYIELCKIIKMIEGGETAKSYHPHCLLHFGEFYSSTDSLNSNLFFKMAKSEFVDHLVMDSNMALFGSPSSPSIVGVLVSTAQGYGKTIHYELATERVIICNEKGILENDMESLNVDSSVSLLIKEGIKAALESGAHAIGVTNLCEPKAIKNLVSNITEEDNDNSQSKGLLLRRASLFKPTAVIFIPYRAFYAFTFAISGSTCGLKPIPCWHESFREVPMFGHGKAAGPGMCSVDVFQDALLNVWDDLRTRHAQVAVIADPEQLTDDLLKSTKERVILRFPCVMTNKTWHFFEGDELFGSYKKKSISYPFLEVLFVNSGLC